MAVGDQSKGGAEAGTGLLGLLGYLGRVRGERFEFHSLFTVGHSQWRERCEGANLEVTLCTSLVSEGLMCSRETSPPPHTHPSQNTCLLQPTVQPPHHTDTQTHTGTQGLLQSINKLGCSVLGEALNVTLKQQLSRLSPRKQHTLPQPLLKCCPGSIITKSVLNPERFGS